VQGNLASKGGVTYSFDYGNRLRQVQSGGSEVESYRYDIHGRRVRSLSGAGALHSMYANDGQLLFQKNERTGKSIDYILLGGSVVAQVEKPIVGGTATTTYQHTDALGSPVASTNASRAVVESSEYEPFGRVGNRSNRDGMGYTGHAEDAATGLVYMQQRYYDPLTGRFDSVDPVTAYGNPVGAFNRYWYASGNPYAFTDPDGRDIKDVWGGFVDGMSGNFLATPSVIQMEPLDIAPQPYGGMSRNSENSDYVIGRAVANAVTVAIEVAAGSLIGSGRSAAGEGGVLARSVSSGGKGLGSPFKGKTAPEIERMFMRKGLEPRGPNPVAGKGGYVNPNNGRSYHIDPLPQAFKKTGVEPPHVDVNRPRDYIGNLEKKKYEL